MKAEKIVLSFIALLAGLIAAGAAFYVYQSTKTIPQQQTKQKTIEKTSPIPKPSLFLNIDRPKDEEVTSNKKITVSGKTEGSAIVVISTPLEDNVVTPSQTGNFSTTVEIDDGENEIHITAIQPNGEDVKLLRTVTFSTENF